MPNAGYPHVRDAIAARLDADGTFPGLTGAQVIMSVGAGGGCNATLKGILNPGEEVVILAAVVLNVVVISLIAIVEVKKIVGPLYRMERAFSRVARGELPEDFVARKKDMPRSLIRSFRAMLYALRQEAQKDIDNARDRSDALEGLVKKVEADTAGKEEILEQLRSTRSMLEETAARKTAGLGGDSAQENLVL